MCVAKKARTSALATSGYGTCMERGPMGSDQGAVPCVEFTCEEAGTLITYRLEVFDTALYGNQVLALGAWPTSKIHSGCVR